MGSIAAQFVAAFLVTSVVAMLGAIHHSASAIAQNTKAVQVSVQTAMPFALIAAVIAGGVAMLLISRLMVRGSLADGSPDGAAWAIGSPRQIRLGLGLGVLIAIAFVALQTIPALRPTHFTPGPLSKMMMSPGMGRIIWLLSAVLLAPPLEELLFRGVLYGGYHRSFGHTKAALIVTLIFCLMHIGEVRRFLLAGVAIGSMALGALWMRLRARAIGPAIAVHLGYNGMLALLQILSWFGEP